jgi:type IV pilus assembly protein PilQ
VRQVLIEARIVIVNDDFSRELGVRFGTTAAFDHGGSDGSGYVGRAVSTRSRQRVRSSTTAASTAAPARAARLIQTPTVNDRYMVNLPIANPRASWP